MTRLLLPLTAAAFAACLRGVRMSTEPTYADTLAALQDAGALVADAVLLRDVDTPDDAERAARAAPGTRFARLWTQVR